MTEPTACCAARCPATTYCDNCDLLVGLTRLHVLEVERAPERLTVTVESAPTPMGCPSCGVVAFSHGRRSVELIDVPSFGRPVRVVWRKRTWSWGSALHGAGWGSVRSKLRRALVDSPVFDVTGVDSARPSTLPSKRPDH